MFLPQIANIITSTGYKLSLYKGLMCHTAEYAHTNQEDIPVHHLRLLQITALNIPTAALVYHKLQDHQAVLYLSQQVSVLYIWIGTKSLTEVI